MNNWNLLVNDFKKQLLREALKNNKGNACKTAKALGVHRNTLERNLAALGIDKYQYRPVPKRILRTGWEGRLASRRETHSATA